MMKFLKKKLGDKNGTPISFWSTDDNILCEDGKTLRENLDKVNSQYKDIANLFSTEQTTNSYKIKCGNKVIAEIPLGSITPSQPTVTKYTVTNNLTNATSNNDVSEVVKDSAYTATITADEGYNIGSVNIKMNDVDITSSVYSNGIINIPNVTGNVIITISCIKIMPTIDNELLIDMDLTGISDGSTTSFTNIVSNDIATIADNKLSGIKNSNVNVDSLKSEGGLTYAYIFDKNIGNPNFCGFNFRAYYNASLYEHSTYGLYLSLFCNDTAASSIYFPSSQYDTDFRKLPDINFAVITLNKDGTLSCYLNGALIHTVPKQDLWKSWNYQYASIKNGISVSTSESNGNCKPLKHIYAYKGALTSDNITKLNDFFLDN